MRQITLERSRATLNAQKSAGDSSLGKEPRNVDVVAQVIDAGAEERPLPWEGFFRTGRFPSSLDRLLWSCVCQRAATPDGKAESCDASALGMASLPLHLPHSAPRHLEEGGTNKVGWPYQASQAAESGPAKRAYPVDGPASASRQLRGSMAMHARLRWRSHPSPNHVGQHEKAAATLILRCHIKIEAPEVRKGRRFALVSTRPAELARSGAARAPLQAKVAIHTLISQRGEWYHGSALSIGPWGEEGAPLVHRAPEEESEEHAKAASVTTECLIQALHRYPEAWSGGFGGMVVSDAAWVGVAAKHSTAVLSKPRSGPLCISSMDPGPPWPKPHQQARRAHQARQSMRKMPCKRTAGVWHISTRMPGRDRKRSCSLARPLAGSAAEKRLRDPPWSISMQAHFGLPVYGGRWTVDGGRWDPRTPFRALAVPCPFLNPFDIQAHINMHPSTPSRSSSPLRTDV